MEWISIKDSMPPFLGNEKDYSVYVWITDGELTEIAQYIYLPRNYGCAVDDDEERATCGPQPHWHPEVDCSSFKKGDKCFGRIEINDVTHWMPLPEPPKEK